MEVNTTTQQVGPYKKIYDPQGTGQKVTIPTGTYNYNADPLATGWNDQTNVNKTSPIQTNGATATGGNGGANAQTGTGTAQVHPVKKANVFATIGQRRAEQEKANQGTYTGFLNAAASDHLAQIDAEKQNAQYAAGLVPEKANTPLPHETNLAQYQREQAVKQGQPWGAEGGEGLKVPEDNRSEFQKFRDQMYDEEKIRKESDKRAKIYAVGDALRNLGNLYFVGSKDASPQKFSVDMGTQEREKYEQGRQNRDALAYQYYNADLKQKMAQAEQARKDTLAANEIARGNSTIQYNDARTKKTLQDMGIQAEKYPYEIQKLMGEAVSAKANGDLKTWESRIKELEYQNTPTSLDLANKLKQAQINHQNASATSALASARYHNAQTAKTMKEMEDSKGENLSFSGYYGTMSRPNKAALSDEEVSSIYAVAKQNGWLDGEGYNSYIEGGVDSKHAMIATISDALQNGSPLKRQELTHYLVNKRKFKITDPTRQKQFDYANPGFDRQTDKKIPVKKKSVLQGRERGGAPAKTTGNTTAKTGTTKVKEPK